ncbi:MAG: hypothetical protein U0361_00700 [Nitrospiraceae bacterium]
MVFNNESGGYDTIEEVQAITQAMMALYNEVVRDPLGKQRSFPPA